MLRIFPELNRMILRHLLLGMTCLAAWPAVAQDRIALAGFEASPDNQYAYLGTVLPLPGEKLGQGLVQRYWLDYVAYRYEKTPAQLIDAKIAGAEAALGYQHGGAGGWWGTYLGVRFADTRLSPDDPGNQDRGRHWRAKLQLEGETEVAPAWRVNGIVSHLLGDDNYWMRVRVQTTLVSQRFVGPEFIAQGAPNYRAYKIGAFVGNIRVGAGSALTLKAGVSKPQNDSASMYAGAEFYIPF
jgi:hypothetical protein